MVLSLIPLPVPIDRLQGHYKVTARRADILSAGHDVCFIFTRPYVIVLRVCCVNGLPVVFELLQQKQKVP
jgi:hypothetical protein